MKVIINELTLTQNNFKEETLIIKTTMIKVLGILCICSILASCSGRDADPVRRLNNSDREMTCKQIEHEVVNIHDEISDLISEKSDKKGKNIGLVIAGLFFFPLWFGLDLNDSQEVELRAYKKRVDVLQQLDTKKDCEIIF